MHVGVLPEQPGRPVRYLRAEPGGVDPGGQLLMPVPVPPPQHGVLPGPLQAFLPELAQGLRQPVPGHAALAVLGDAGWTCRPARPAAPAPARRPAGDRRRRPRPHPARTRRRTPTAAPTAAARPRCTAHGSTRSSARSVCCRAGLARLPRVSSRQPVAQPGVDLLRRQHPHPRRGQLDGQRHALQPAADPGHRRPVRLGHREPRHHLPGPRGEQGAPPGTASTCATVSRCPALRRGQRRHRQHRLRRRCSAIRGWWPAPAARAPPQQQVGQLGGRVHQVLAVVQHQQQLPAGEVRRPAPPRAQDPARSSQPQRARAWPGLPAPGSRSWSSWTSHTPSRNARRSPAAARSASRVLPTPPIPVSVTSRELRQQPPDLGQLIAAADEAGQLRRQIPCYAPPRCHNRSTLRRRPGIRNARCAAVSPATMARVAR